ncbi:MAG: hypothetical protein HC929_20245 [Leptolyngbyaceae cyanobacterium SM2_5_2]|nr:hypothetical protein [Leptolyngbyaceae cyanobacterium SM2_5_2]
MKSVISTRPQPLYSVASLTLLAGTLSLATPAIANPSPQIQVNQDGSVQVNSNAFRFSTGELQNTSNIPLPAGLITNPQEGRPQPTRPGQLAPSSVELQVDAANIEAQFQPQAPGFAIQHDSLELSTQFNLQHIPRAHAFGEGIQVTVYGPDGTIKHQETAFVRGDSVQVGPQGQTLPSSAQINVTYGATDTVELRVLNLRNNGGQAHQSAIYFANNGQFAVEDLPNGGDRDFNDGDYFRLAGGRGEADIVEEYQTISETISYRTVTVETALDPLLRQEEVIEEVRLEEDQRFTTVEEERQWGQVEINQASAGPLAHATGVRTDNDEQLIYNQYSGAAQIRLGSDGASLTGQLSPLAGNPAAPPTLLHGTLRVDPTANANQAGLTATVGVTQFLHPTHRDAVDMFGNRVVSADPDGPRLVQPTGLIHNTRLVGYVPATPDQVIPGERLPAVNGIFDLPADKAVTIAPLDASLVGPGHAAYTHNVGGLIIENTDGRAEFVPQWTHQGHATQPITLAAGEARRVIYALVPQQPGQDLQLNQRYALTTVDPSGTYRIAEGNFLVISAAQHPENFYLEGAEVYAVEDTLAGQNAVVARFNGIQGQYRYVPGGELVATYNLTDPADVDARVGTLLSTPDQIVPGEAGQMGYFTTSVAGGLYGRGALSLGLGNQEDTLSTTITTLQSELDGLYRQSRVNLFATPRTQVDTQTTTLITRATETTRQTGTASFDIDANGLLSNVNLQVNPAATSSQAEVLEGPTVTDSTILHGAEYLVSSTVTPLSGQGLVAGDALPVHHQVTTATESYPNLSPVLGELAFGGVLNLGNTPWTPAANILRAEVFMRGIVIGQSHDSGDTGLRAEAVFNPLGSATPCLRL